jgi:hypothetical protein
MQLKKSFRKGCHIVASNMEEETRDKVTRIEDHPILSDFEDVFGEIPEFPPNKDIDLSINLVPRIALVSKTPYIMGTPELKEL